MDINIKIDEGYVKKMFYNHCNKRSCVDCNCQVLPNENYEECYSKYIDTLFNIDIQNNIDRLIENIE